MKVVFFRERVTIPFAKATLLVWYVKIVMKKKGTRLLCCAFPCPDRVWKWGYERNEYPWGWYIGSCKATPRTVDTQRYSAGAAALIRPEGEPKCHFRASNWVVRSWSIGRSFELYILELHWFTGLHFPLTNIFSLFTSYTSQC